MANAIVKISKRAKQISRANKNKAWKDCIAQASREYKAGKLGAVKKASTRQTGGSNTKRDKQRRAKPPGKRISESGNVYYERRKNRSDKPGSMAGMIAGVNEKTLSEKSAQLTRVIAAANMLKKAIPKAKGERKDQLKTIYKIRLSQIRQLKADLSKMAKRK